jgi:hypothetical protein
MNIGAIIIRLQALLWLLLILAGWPQRLPAQVYDPCISCPAPCPEQCEPATCTIRVPQLVTEYQTKWVTRYRPEVRERMTTVYRNVPTTETVPEDYTVLVPEKRTRTVVDTINHPVYGDIQLRTTSMTPEVDVRQGSYTVTHMVPVQEERTVRPSAAPVPAPPVAAPDVDPNAPPPPPAAADAAVAGGACCDPCTPCKVCVTTWKPVSERVTVDYPLTRFKPDARTRTVSFYEYQPEKKVREESYVVEVPQIRTGTRQITVMRPVAEQQPEKYTVMVPYQERMRVPVLTRRYVEQTIIVR